MLPIHMTPSQRMLNETDELLSTILVGKQGSTWTDYKIRHLSEDVKSVVSQNIVTKLYNDIKRKALSVDFGPVDVSKGNIAKLKNYSSITNSLKYLNQISEKSKGLKEITTELQKTHDILLRNSREFERGYAMNKEFVRYLYGSACINLIQAISYVIAESIEFVKDSINLYKPEVLENKLKKIEKNSFLTNLIKFNLIDKKGGFKKLLKDSDTLNESVTILAISASVLATKVISLIGAVGLALYVIRSTVYLYYNTRVKISHYLRHLDEFIRLNTSTMSGDSKKIKEKQEGIAKFLRKMSDIIAVDANVADSRTKDEIKDKDTDTAKETGEDDGAVIF